MNAMSLESEKLEFNARAKAAMQLYLKSRTWPEKIRSIERMNQAARLAREAMRRARAKDSSRKETSVPSDSPAAALDIRPRS